MVLSSWIQVANASCSTRLQALGLLAHSAASWLVNQYQGLLDQGRAIGRIVKALYTASMGPLGRTTIGRTNWWQASPSIKGPSIVDILEAEVYIRAACPARASRLFQTHHAMQMH